MSIFFIIYVLSYSLIVDFVTNWYQSLIIRVSKFRIYLIIKDVWHERINRKIHRRNNFFLWQIKMRFLLKQQGLWVPLTVKSKKLAMDDAKSQILEEKAHSMIMLYVANDVIIEVADEETATGVWLKLESLYTTKSLTKKLFLRNVCIIYVCRKVRLFEIILIS